MDEIQLVVQTMAPLQQNLTVALDQFKSATTKLNLTNLNLPAPVVPVYDQYGQQVNAAGESHDIIVYVLINLYSMS